MDVQVQVRVQCQLLIKKWGAPSCARLCGCASFNHIPSPPVGMQSACVRVLSKIGTHICTEVELIV
jgi:hypothetical protein